MTQVGEGHIGIQIDGDGNTVNLDLPHLELTTHPGRRRPARTELELVDPFRRITPPVAREEDMASAWRFLHSEKRIAVRTIIGRAGAGKTRLAVDLIEKLETEAKPRWFAGFVTAKELRRFIDTQNLSAWGWQAPTLIVVDYAAEQAATLKAWLSELASNTKPGLPPLRILLLERHASAEDGWLRSLKEDGYTDVVSELFDPFEPVTLRPLDESANRRRVLDDFLTSAAQFLKVPRPNLPPAGVDPTFEQSLAQEVWQDPLYLHMAALLACGAGTPLIQVLV